MSRAKMDKPGGKRRHAERSNLQVAFPSKPSHLDAESDSCNKLKKRLRDVERLLQSGKELPADVEVAKQRERQSLRHDLKKAEAKKKRSKLVSKYHRVRFHERQKADRRLKQAKRNLEQSKDQSLQESLEMKIHIAQIDLNYTLYHPLLVPYSSLFAEKPGDTIYNQGNEGDLLAARQKNPVWRSVEVATTSGEAALKALREKGYNGEDDEPVPVANDKTKSKTTTRRRPNRSEAQNHVSETADVEEEDDGSDDNFFE